MKTIKLTLVQAGWETYSGLLGDVEFLDGQSIAEVPVQSAIRLGADFTILDQDGIQVTPIDYLLDYDPSNEEAHVETCLTLDQIGFVAPPPVATKIVPAGSGFVPEPGKDYTRSELETIADSDGIDGLREIGDPLAIKSRAITDMIDKIIAAQANRAAATQNK